MEELPDYTLDEEDIFDIFSSKKKQPKQKVDIFKTNTKQQQSTKSVRFDEDVDVKPVQTKEDMGGLFNGNLKDFVDSIDVLKGQVKRVKSRLENEELETGNGLSYLELKNEILLGYLTNLTYYMTLKTNGESVSGHKVVERLLRQRLIIEKLKPVDNRLKYQIEKMINIANAGDLSTVSNSLKYRPNIEDFDESDDVEENSEDYFDKKYVVQKNLAVEYDEGITKEEKEENRIKQRAKRGRMAQFIKEKYGTAPEEEAFNEFLTHVDKQEKFREEKLVEYEEDNFTRLNRPKALRRKTKSKLQEEQFHNALDDFESFDSLSGLGEMKKQKTSIKSKLAEQDWRRNIDSRPPARKKRRKN